MNNHDFRKIELTLNSENLVTKYQFKGKLIGRARYVDEEEDSLPQEVIRIYQRKYDNFLSYMEYSDRDNGIWNSKVFVSDELDLAKIKNGLTRESYSFGDLLIKNVPSKILRTAVYRAIENRRFS